ASEYLPVRKRHRSRSGLMLRRAQTSAVRYRLFSGNPNLFRRRGGSFLSDPSRLISISRSAPKCESASLRLFWRSFARMLLHASVDPALSGADLRAAAGPDRPAHSGTRGEIQRAGPGRGRRGFGGDSRSDPGGTGGTVPAAGALRSLLQRADDAPDAPALLQARCREREADGERHHQAWPVGAGVRSHPEGVADDFGPRGEREEPGLHASRSLAVGAIGRPPRQR